MNAYSPFDWFWIVAGDDSRAWSSAAGAYVADYDAALVTRIVSEAELNDVLRPYGLMLPAPTQADYSQAIQAHIDGVARSRNYADGVALTSYTVSTIPAWAAEAQAFAAWRDAVWASAYTTLASVLAGQQPQPTMSELIGSLPEIAW